MSGLEIVLQKDVAAAFGVPPQAISRLVQKGMPITSIADAQAWQEKHELKTPRGFYDLEASQVRRATCDVRRVTCDV